MCQNVSPSLKLNRPRLAIVYCYIQSGHIWQKSIGDLSKRFSMYKTQIDHGWLLPIAIFIQGIFGTGMEVCRNSSACLQHNKPQLAIVYCHIYSGHIQHKSRGVSRHFNRPQLSIPIVIFIQCIFSTRVVVHQNISACLKLNRPQLASVYCHIHSGHI